MKLDLNLLNRRREGEERRKPSHLFGSRVRTSTVVLIVAFLALWWTYETYGPQEQSRSDTPPSQVVPPGFVPDPAYTWVPRTRLEQPGNTAPTPTGTPTPTTTPPPPPVTTTTMSPASPPCLLPPPFCPPSSSAAPPPSTPPPGVSPSPSSGLIPAPPGR